MAVGLSNAVATSIMNAAFRATAYTGPAALFVKLHIGDPGVAGAGSVAGNDTRKAVTFGAPTGTGAIANTADLVWSLAEVDTSEDYTHYSLWDSVGPAGGVFHSSGLITANAVVAGNEFKIPAGDLDITPVVAA